MEINELDLGNAIRDARMKCGYTQEYLAEVLDITPGHLQHIERGVRKPSVPMLLKMMKLLSFSVDELVFGSEHKSLNADGLSAEQFSALQALIDTMRQPN